MELFLSYSSADQTSVMGVQKLLKARGITTFLDRDNLVSGVAWPQALEQALRAVDGVAVFIGGELGGWQKREMWFALDRQVREEKEDRPFPVIPVLLQGADLTPGFLFLNTWIDLRQGLDDIFTAEALNAFEQAIKTTKPVRHYEDSAARAMEYAAAVICPYRGLQIFREEDAAFFAGRKAFAKQLLDFTLDKNLMAVVGPSGSGKSSVVQAGLIPLLRRELPPANTWDAVSFTPGDEPFHRLASALIPLLDPDLSETARLAEARALGCDLVADKIRVEDVINRVIQKSNGTGRLLLVADQFEELFTNTPEAGRLPFANALLHARGRLPVTILINLRADFYSQIIALDRDLSDVLASAQVNIGALTPDELRESITVPARLVGLEFEAGLVDRILSDVGTEPGRLPLVEFALTEIWQRREGRRLTNKAYDEIKGVSGALARRAEAEFARLNPEEQTGAQRLFSRLVRVAKPDEAGEDTRQRAELFESDRLMKHVAKRLADARLLVTSGETGTGTISVEVAHEVLIGNWKRLRNWLNDAREFLLWRQRLNGLLAEWERAQESDEAVLRGPLLIEAQKWSDQRSQDLSDQERKFISASREKRERLVREEKERQQRELAEAEKRRLEQAAAAKSLRRLVWVLAAVAFAALGGAIFGFWQRNEAENRRHDADVAKAEANHAHDLADGLINFMLFDLSQKLSAIGRLDILDDVGKKAQDYLQKLPKDVITKSRQQQESAVLLNLGYIYRLRGNLEKAHTAYQQSLEIIRRLAEQDPTNRGWQSDLSKRYERVGDVLRDQGDLAGALNSYRDSLAIREKLAKQDPSNASWQSDLSSSYERVGDVLRDQGDLAGALNSYRDSLAIREKLAKQNPSNASWQSDLSSSYEKAGDVLRDRGDWAGVLNLYRDSLTIREKLVNQYPSNVSWQSDLSNSYERVGDGLRERGDLAGALNSHRQSLAIRERLAKQDPGNAGWQRNLSISYERLGDVLRDQGDLAGALNSYRDSLAIMEQLAKQDPSNASWQSDLSNSYKRVGDVLRDQGDLAGALNSYRDSLTIREKLAKQDTSNASWQSDLAFLYIWTGTTLARAEPKSKTEAREMIRKAQDIVRSLKERTDLTAQQQGWLHAIESALHEVGD